MNNINTENIHIVLHEIGHTFALDGMSHLALLLFLLTSSADFYDWTPTGVTNFIMKAGASTVITDFDAWMLRDWWRNLKSRYGL